MELLLADINNITIKSCILYSEQNACIQIVDDAVDNIDTILLAVFFIFNGVFIIVLKINVVFIEINIVKLHIKLSVISIFLNCFAINNAISGEEKELTLDTNGSYCKGFGPQTPRDIDSVHGKNKKVFSKAPHYSEMNLCNIHYHNNAEHKAKDFSVYVGEGKKGIGGGYQCNISKSLTKAELTPPKGSVCEGLKPGDTIEVHWVYTSCDVYPGEGLASCLSEKCANPNLRVETQVFTVVNDPSAFNFNELSYTGIVNGYHQAKPLPKNTGHPIEFLGSTTGPTYNEQQCSPLQVTWSVRPQCSKVDISSLGKWCKNNIFNEDHGHGVRKLVTNPQLLSEIK